MDVVYWTAFAFLCAGLSVAVIAWVLGRSSADRKTLLIIRGSYTAASASLFFVANQWLIGSMMAVVTVLTVIAVVFRVLSERLDRELRELEG